MKKPKMPYKASLALAMLLFTAACVRYVVHDEDAAKYKGLAERCQAREAELQEQLDEAIRQIERLQQCQ